MSEGNFEHTLRTPDDRTIRFYDSGPQTGPTRTVIWQHGTPQTGRLLEPLLADAAQRGIRLVSCARAGYPGSSARRGRTVTSSAADVIAVADALGLAGFATMGASGGGPHALGCAALAPDRVRGVVTLAGIAPFTEDFDWFAGMVSPGGLRAARRGRAARARFAETAQFDQNSFIEADWRALADDWAPLGSDAERAAGDGPDGEIDDDVAFTTPWGFALAEVQVPVLVVQGGLDRIVPPAHARWMTEQLPHGELWLKPRDGHISVLGACPVAFDWLADIA
ncbi:MAG: alpha/beta hydrolase [Microbacteriaceae bacterium]